MFVEVFIYWINTIYCCLTFSTMLAFNHFNGVLEQSVATVWTSFECVCLCQVMLTDMENSKKTLEEELHKTSEVRVSTCTCVEDVDGYLHLNVLLSFLESLCDCGGEHPAQEPSAGC